MKTLFFGDSLTYSYMAPFGRKQSELRWTTMLINNNPDEDIIIDGVCGRSLHASVSNRLKTEYDGQWVVKDAIAKHKGIDRVVIFLGTNDLIHEKVTTNDVLCKHLEMMISATKEANKNIKIILVCPPMWGQKIQPEFAINFKDNIVEAYMKTGLEVINLSSKVVAPDWNQKDADGVHMTNTEEVKIFEIFQSELFE